MNKEKQQIEEMAKVIASVPPIEFPIGSRKQGRHIYTATKIAEHLYNADYRKQSEGEWVEKAKCGVSIKGYMVCSVCDVMIPACDADGDYYCLSRLDYCPRCGAGMKGGAE